jgi:predicted DNA-binding transcriptional regulator YafY
MPKSKNQFFRLRIIDSALRNSTWVKSARLQKLIQEALLESVDIRTVQMDIKAMKEDTRLGFYAPIEYDSKNKAYRYTDRDYSIFNFALNADEVNALRFYASCLKIYSGYGIFKDFSDAIRKIVDGVSIKHSLKKETNPELIVQTDTMADSSNNEYLTTIIRAIDEGICIAFEYQKFGELTKKKRELSPYLLKEYKNRWYVLGLPAEKKAVATFALDRMTSLRLSGAAFQRSSTFDHAKYFKHSFGITTPNDAVQKIILDYSAREAPYIKSLPVHSTQEIIKETSKGLRISIEVIPSYELYEYILGKTPDIKVISPASLADHIAGMLASGAAQY